MQAPEEPVSLYDEARAAMRVKGPPCKVALLPDDVRDEVEAALADPSIHATALARVLKEHGHDCGHETLQRHRSGDCRCR